MDQAARRLERMDNTCLVHLSDSVSPSLSMKYPGRLAQPGSTCPSDQSQVPAPGDAAALGVAVAGRGGVFPDGLGCRIVARADGQPIVDVAWLE